MTRAAYHGHEALTFSDYTDLDTGRMLHAEPGDTYDIAPASGRAVPDIPQGWFAPLGQQDQDETAAAEGDAAAPASGEDAAEDEEPDGEQQDE